MAEQVAAPQQAVEVTPPTAEATPQATQAAEATPQMPDMTGIPANVQKVLIEGSKERGLDPRLTLGILGAENNGFTDLNPAKVSPKGARGLFQLTPGAVQTVGQDPTKFKYDNGYKNSIAALDYIKKLNDQFGGDGPTVAAAYNAGPTRVSRILSRGGKLTDVPVDTDKDGVTYLQKFARYSGGMGAVANAKSEAQGEVGPATAGSLTAEQQLAQEEASSAADAANPESIPGEIGGWLNSHLVQPSIDSFTEFPKTMVQNGLAASQRVASAIDNATGGITQLRDPSEEQLPFKGISVPSMANFAGAVAWPATAVGGAVAGGGSAVLNAAEAAAKAEAKKEGIDWNGLSSGEMTARTYKHINLDTVKENIGTILMGTTLGGVLPSGKATSARVAAADAEHAAAQGALNAEDIAKYHADLGDLSARTGAVQEANATAIGNATMAHNADKYAIDEANKASLQEADLFNAQNEAAKIADQAGADAYAKSLAWQEADIKAAEDLTGVKRVPQNAGDLELIKHNQVTRDILLNENPLTKKGDPSTKFYEELTTEHGSRIVDPEAVDNFNNALKEIRLQAKRSTRLEGPLQKLGRFLGDDTGVTPKIEALESARANAESMAANGSYPADMRAKAAAKAQDLAQQAQVLREQLSPVTVQEVLDRSQAIDAFRRSEDFRATSTARDRNIIKRITNQIRQPAEEGGLLAAAFTPEENALHAQATVSSKIYNQQVRQTDMIMQAFGDSKPGASAIRNKLAQNERVLRASWGPESYDRMKELATAIDTLYAKLPKAPEITAKADMIPKLTPYPEGGFKYPSSLKPLPTDRPTLRSRELTPEQQLHIQNANRAINAINDALSRGAQSKVVRAAIVGGALTSSATGHMAGLALSGAAMGLALTVPPITHAVSTILRYADRPGSRQFAHAMAELVTANMIHQAYSPGLPESEPIPGIDIPSTPPPPPTAMQPPTPSLPPMAGRPTGGPVPGPSPGLGQPGMPRVKSMSPL